MTRLSSRPIYILTYRRDRVLTYESLCESLRDRTYMVVDSKDRNRLRKTYPSAKFLFCRHQGIGSDPVRDWILRHHYRSWTKGDVSSPVCPIFDDDLGLKSAAWEEGKKRFRTASPRCQLRYFNEIYNRCREDPDVVWGSLSSPYFNNTRDKWLENKRASCCFFVDVDKQQDNDIWFDRIPNHNCGDLVFALDTWLAGYKSINHSYIAITNAASGIGGESAAGGEGRGNRLDDALNWIHNKYPDVTRLYSDISKVWRDLGASIDIRIYGSKAYKIGVSHREQRAIAKSRGMQQER